MKLALAALLLLLPGTARAVDWSGDPLSGVRVPRFETIYHAQPLDSDVVAKEYDEDDAPGLILSGDGSGRVLIDFEAADTDKQPYQYQTVQFYFPQLVYDPAAKTISRSGVMIGRLGRWFWEFEPGWQFGWRYEKQDDKIRVVVFLRKP